jgi:hypothetical protein
MAGNRAVTFMGPHRMEIQDKGDPELVDPQGRKIEHAVILKLVVTTNICGPYLTPLLNTEVISVGEAPEAYKIFHDGSPKKFVIDPHNVTKLAAGTETTRARRPRAAHPAH